MDENAAYTDVLRIKKKFRESLQLSCYFNDAQVVQVERYSDQVLKLKKEAHNKWKPGIKLRKKNLGSNECLSYFFDGSFFLFQFSQVENHLVTNERTRPRSSALAGPITFTTITYNRI